MSYINDIRELIGNTPLLKINNFHLPKDVNLFAKLEYLNPGGSVKDRIGMAMIADAERSGLVRQTWRTSRRCKSAVSPVDGNNEPMQGCLP